MFHIVSSMDTLEIKFFLGHVITTGKPNTASMKLVFKSGHITLVSILNLIILITLFVVMAIFASERTV